MGLILAASGAAKRGRGEGVRARSASYAVQRLGMPKAESVIFVAFFSEYCQTPAQKMGCKS